MIKMKKHLINFLTRLGIHIHQWTYYTEYEDFGNIVLLDDMRECPGCGTREQYIVVPAAGVSSAGWIEV
jgi:hypothetical protein